MKKYNTAYYLLFVLLTMGGFAAMAQNDYGITILGIVSFSFGLLFAIQLLSFLNKKTELDNWTVIELVCLILLATIMGLRVFYIHFALVELVFVSAGIVLILVWGRKLMLAYMESKILNVRISLIVVLFHSSILCYLVSTVMVPFLPTMAEPLGVVAFILCILYLIGATLSRNLMIKGEDISAFAFIGRIKDRSVVILSLFILFTLYMGLTKVGALPKMYSDEFPQSYFGLVDRAERGNEQPVNGKYKHEEFKKMFERFVERNNDID